MPDNVMDRVRDETERFQLALPKLMKTHAGRWIVFRDGNVQSDHAAEAEAYASAIEQFGHEGGFVVARVVPQEPTPITAAVLFGV